MFQLNEELFPATNTTISFQSELGYASSDEVARVQVSADGGANWSDLYAQPGDDSYETSFTPHTLSLSNYAGMTILVRFNFDFAGGTFYNSGSPIGWFFTDIVVTNVQAVVNQTVNNSTVTNIIAGDLADSANNGMGNFTITPPPYYYVITNPPAGAEPACFHLTHLDPASQLFQFNEIFLPSADSAISFASQLGYSTSDETARVQASTNNGATWDDLFVEAGGANTPESSFTPYTFSLSQYAGQLTLLRFNFAFTGGGFYPQSDNYIGWNIEDIVVTNVQQPSVSTVNTTNFTFTPGQPGMLSASSTTRHFRPVPAELRSGQGSDGDFNGDFHGTAGGDEWHCATAIHGQRPGGHISFAAGQPAWRSVDNEFPCDLDDQYPRQFLQLHDHQWTGHAILSRSNSVIRD